MSVNSQMAFMSGYTSAKRVIIPVFLDQEPKAVAVVRIGRLFTDYERKGFFRIGLLRVCFRNIV